VAGRLIGILKAADLKSGTGILGNSWTFAFTGERKKRVRIKAN